MEHVTCGENWLPVGIDFPIRTKEITVTSDDFLCFGVPHNELFAAVFHGVELVDIHGFACASAGCTEGNLAQSTNLLHDIRCIVSRHNIDFIVAFIGHAKLPFGSKFTLQQSFINRLDNLFFHFLFSLGRYFIFK